MTESNKKGKSIKERILSAKRSQKIRFAIVSVLFFAFLTWLGNWWFLLVYPVLVDIYLTRYVRWDWWRTSKSSVVRTVMSWIDAIVYALVLVYIIFTFIGQNYKIPSSSLEKTLLVGDYLWVNKMCYGPRVPITPIHFPLCQNTFPIINTKSYLDHPENEYRRLKGFRKVERNDIVVFNFPAGDTIAYNVQNPDYYTSCYIEGFKQQNPTSLQEYYSYEFGKRCIELGRRVVNQHPEYFGKVMYRPVDRRENYVKRCIGLPGDYLKIVDQTVYINGKPLEEPENLQFNYDIYTNGQSISDEDWEKAGISLADRNAPVANADGEMVYDKKMNRDGSFYSGGVPLTKKAVAYFKSLPYVTAVERSEVMEPCPPYPITRYYGWTRANYATNIAQGGMWIPKKGVTLKLNMFNLPVYERCIRNYERNDLQVRDGKIFINGKQTDSYTFKMDYYWMMGDNRDNSLDSRYWGFVPEDHIVGTPMFVIISFDEDKPLFSGIRWNRIFKDANPDK